MKKILILLMILICNVSFSQETIKDSVSSGWKFLPTNKLFNPIEAAIFESKIGVTRFTNKNLKLDIGGKADIVGLQIKKNHYSLGAEFFTFSYLRSEDNFKFPVDAIDYYFGISLNFKREISSSLNLSSRLCFGHISSHFEDGHKYETVLLPAPVIYSREFTQIDGILEYSKNKLILRNEIGLRYLFHTIPDEFGKISFNYGIEARYLLSNIFNVYFSDEVIVESVSGNTNGNNNIETGINIGGINKTGVSIYYTYYDGTDYKGQYYGKYFNSKGIGFKVNF